jgi:hypothetical protein
MALTILRATPYAVTSYAFGSALLVTRDDGAWGTASCLLQGDEALSLETALACCQPGEEVDLVLRHFDDLMGSTLLNMRAAA